MHRTVLALTLTASFLTLAPSGLLSRLWELVSGRPETPASRIQLKEGPGWDPSGLAAPLPQSEAGGEWDPSGHS